MLRESRWLMATVVALAVLAAGAGAVHAQAVVYYQPAPVVTSYYSAPVVTSYYYSAAPLTTYRYGPFGRLRSVSSYYAAPAYYAPTVVRYRGWAVYP